VFLDAGKQAHILNIDTLDEVFTIKTNQPTRYTQKVNISKNERYIVSGMEKGLIIVHSLDLKNVEKELRCRKVHEL
jgi:hypothetical protein